ncbi:hypothetical protein C5B85_07895 [Pseudoclavibacter sp. AY1F1]|nr:hypothetical protein C5B85_07895 [Pseudoclavibacter sp. AY1F1]
MLADESRAPQPQAPDATAYPAPQSLPEQAERAPSVPTADPTLAPHAYGSMFSGGSDNKR